MEKACVLFPSFCLDAGMEIENGETFRTWVNELEKVSNLSIITFKDFIDALKSRHDFFDEMGCKASDHGIHKPYAENFSMGQVSDIFDQVMRKELVSESEACIFKSAFLYYCGIMNYEKNWVMQYHIGPIRNNNSRMKAKLGMNAGFDSIGDVSMAKSLAKMLNRLDAENMLPKTILYNINPRDNELFSSMAGNFPSESIPGKVQHGPSWWFLDQKNGIEQHIESISNIGILYEFVGMTTDSRSFLSFQRHDYFRRILCNILGKEMEEGLIPSDPELMASYIERICYSNAKNFFGFSI
ncbi:MAG: glucuronate isomerase [Balneolaceae bacterium]